MSVFKIHTQHLLTLKLPYPPSVNNYYGYNRRTGAIFIKKEGRDYRHKVVDTLRPALAKQNWEPLKVPLSVWCEVHCPDHRHRDLDNLNKCLLDSLSHAGVYKSDFHIDDLRCTRGEVEKPGYVRVFIRKIIGEDE